MLQPHEKYILADTFGRSPMLQESIKSGLVKAKENDVKTVVLGVRDSMGVINQSEFKLLSECVGILSTRSGMRPDFIWDNINEISEL